MEVDAHDALEVDELRQLELANVLVHGEERNWNAQQKLKRNSY